MHPVPVPAHRELGRQLHRGGGPQVDAGRDGGGGDPGQHPQRGQPRLAEPGGHGVVPLGQQRLCQPVLKPRLQPGPLVHRVGLRGQVEHRRPPQVQHHAGRGPQRPAAQAELRPDQAGHHLGRNRRRPVEQVPLVFQRAGDVVVDAVDGGLLLAADHQHRGPQHDQRPQHRRLRRRQRPERAERAHRGQHRAGFGPGVPQHRGDRDGELADRPRGGQVAEVDDPVRGPQPALEAADHVVVGHVAVHRLPRQLPGQRLHPAPGRGRRPGHPGAQLLVPHVPGQRVHHAQRVPQVPLQHPVEPRVGERAQRQAHLPGHRAQGRDHPRGQVAARARERPAGQVAQHPGQGHAAVHRHDDRSVHHRPGPQPGGRDALRRAVLRLDLGRAERRVRDLQHPGHAPGRLGQQEVAVLLAAQRLRPYRQAERGSRDSFGVLDRHPRHRQPAVREEVDPGLRGRRQSGPPCRRRRAAAARRAPRPARAAR